MMLGGYMKKRCCYGKVAEEAPHLDYYGVKDSCKDWMIRDCVLGQCMPAVVQ